jgi:nucleoside-diphosphate-sugar epimerase
MTNEVIVISGSTGLIGGALVRALGSSFAVIGLDNDPPKQLQPMLEHVHVDFGALDSVQTALRHVRLAYGSRIAGFIHLAAYYDFSGQPSPLYEQVTLRGTERLVRELRQFEVEQFVFSSSMLVHAPTQPGVPITEASPLEPKWEYPKSKADTEALLLAERHEMPVSILRIAGVYDDRCHSIPLAHQIQRIFERRMIGHVFPGDPTHGQAFVHLEDVVDAIARIVERRRALDPSLTLLLGEASTLSYEQLQREFGRLIHGKDWNTLQFAKPVAKAGAWLQEQAPGEEPFIKPWMIDLADDHYELDISKARAVLGWAPARSLQATLPRMVAALRADPVGWYREHELEVPAWLAAEVEKGSGPERHAHAP